MQTTASGIAYPDDSDPSDLKSLLTTMASSVENTVAATVSDSGWIDLATNSGFKPQAGIAPQIRKIGKTVYMRWGWESYGMSLNGTFEVSMIPVGYRPTQALYGWCGSNHADRIARGIIYTSGSVVITTASSGLLSGYYLFGNFNWQVD